MLIAKSESGDFCSGPKGILLSLFMKRKYGAKGYRVSGLGIRPGNRLDGAGGASYGSNRVVRKVGVVMNRNITKILVTAIVALGWIFFVPRGAQAQDQPQPPANSQAQTPTQDDSVTEAAKKAKKDKPAPKKVYSEDDIARLPGTGVSVVGQAPPPPSDKEKTKSASGGKGDADNGEKEEVKDEAYWRKRARKILDQMDALDDQIQQARDDAKKTKPTQAASSSSDSTGGNQTNAEVQVDDAKTRLQDLEKQKADLQKQLDSLQEEGRRAGAPASWFR